jgi:hypothetical protein
LNGASFALFTTLRSQEVAVACQLDLISFRDLARPIEAIQDEVLRTAQTTNR